MQHHMRLPESIGAFLHDTGHKWPREFTERPPATLTSPGQQPLRGVHPAIHRLLVAQHQAGNHLLTR